MSAYRKFVDTLQGELRTFAPPKPPLVSVRKEVESDESVVIQGWWPDSGGATNVDEREPPQIQS